MIKYAREGTQTIEDGNNPDVIRIDLSDISEKTEETVTTVTYDRTSSVITHAPQKRAHSSSKSKTYKPQKQKKTQEPRKTQKTAKTKKSGVELPVVYISDSGRSIPILRKEEDDSERTKTRKSLLKKLLIVFSVILILFGTMGGVVLYKMFGMHFITHEPPIDRASEDFVTDEYDREYAAENAFSEVDPDDVDLELVEPVHDEDLLNILLIGQDRRPGETRARSDAMILCSINTDTGEVALVSFLRDLYVTIPGYSDNRLNAAYAFGGFDLLKDTLLTNFGVTADGCFEVDFDNFTSLIDLIGGTDITISEAEANIIGDGAQAGLCHLSGAQTLRYARIRKIGSDFGRTDRQRKVLSACLEKVRGLSTPELLDLADTALPFLSTDMTTLQITSIAAKLAPLRSGISLKTYFVPAQGKYYDAMIMGMAVLVPDLKANRDLLRNEYLPFTD